MVGRFAFILPTQLIVTLLVMTADIKTSSPRAVRLSCSTVREYGTKLDLPTAKGLA